MIKEIIILSLFCFSSFGMQHSEENYKSFLATLINNNGVGELEINEKKIIVHGSIKQIDQFQENFQKALSSSKELGKNLHYSIPVCEEVEKTTFNLDTIDDAKKFLKEILGSTFKDLSLDLGALFNEDAEFVNGRLSSKNIIPRHKKVYLEHCGSLAECFSGYSDQEIREAWDEKKELLAREEKINQPNPIGKKCIFLSSSNEKYCVNIDLRGIFERTHAISYSETNNDKAVLVIDKAMLFERLQKLIGGDMFLRLVRSEEEKAVAFPIILPKPEAENGLPGLHFLVIDTSSSMEQVIDNLKKKLLRFVEYISKKDRGAFAQLINFGNDTIFDRSIIAIIDNKLTAQIESLHAVGLTRLYATLKELFEKIRHEQLSDRYKITLTLFTDGHNNQGSSASQVKDAIDAIDVERRPHSITFGLGDVDNALGDFTKETGGHYYPITALDEVEDLLKQELIVANKQNFVDVLISIGEEIKQRLRIARHESEIVMPPLALEVNAKTKVTCNGQKFDGFNLSSGLQELPDDKIMTMYAEIYRIGSDDSKTSKQKIEELLAIKQDIDNVFEGDLVNPIRDSALKYIDKYIVLFEQHQEKAKVNNLKAALSTLSGIFSSGKK